MMGVILAIAAFAVVTSVIATIGNLARARNHHPDLKYDYGCDRRSAGPRVIRFIHHTLVARIFVFQAVILWALLAVLVVYRLLIGT
jgi:hypothetical protein